jgi:hypothetical protein
MKRSEFVQRTVIAAIARTGYYQVDQRSALVEEAQKVADEVQAREPFDSEGVLHEKIIVLLTATDRVLQLAGHARIMAEDWEMLRDAREAFRPRFK